VWDIPRIWIPQVAAQSLEVCLGQGRHETISLDENGWADLGAWAEEGMLEFRYRSRRLLACFALIITSRKSRIELLVQLQMIYERIH